MSLKNVHDFAYSVANKICLEKKDNLHTIMLADWTLKKWGLSSFAFQSF